MINFAHFLLVVFIIFTCLCLFFCVEAHFRYQNKPGIDDERNFGRNYRYFGQPIYNQDNHVTGYELLLRELDTSSGKWRLPKNVVHFPLSRIVNTIKKTSPQFTENISYLAINMTVSQLIDFRADYFFTWVLGTTDIQQLVVEIDANDLQNSSIFQRHQVRQVLRKIDPGKIQVTIENVDSSQKTYILLHRFLPLIDYLKFNIGAFEKSEHHWIDITLAQWQRRCQTYGVQAIVSKIENQDHVALVDQLNVKFRQGYAYGRPEKLEK